MGAYLTIEKNISDMLEEFCNNENIQKLLSNPEKSALTDSLPIGFNKFNLLNNQIYDIPKIPDPVSEQKCFIMAYLYEGKFAGRSNIYQYNMYVDVHVICHIDTWILNAGKKRTLQLLHEIDKTVRNTKTQSIRGSWIVDRPAEFLSYNDVFKGYVMRFKVTNKSKSCGD